MRGDRPKGHCLVGGNAAVYCPTLVLIAGRSPGRTFPGVGARTPAGGTCPGGCGDLERRYNGRRSSLHHVWHIAASGPVPSFSASLCVPKGSPCPVRHHPGWSVCGRGRTPARGWCACRTPAAGHRRSASGPMTLDPRWRSGRSNWPGRERRFAEPAATSVHQVVPFVAAAIRAQIRPPWFMFGHSMGGLGGFAGRTGTTVLLHTVPLSTIELRMSCRVFSRGIEHAVLQYVVDVARRGGGGPARGRVPRHRPQRTRRGLLPRGRLRRRVRGGRRVTRYGLPLTPRPMVRPAWIVLNSIVLNSEEGNVHV
jgi:hypothetical protein